MSELRLYFAYGSNLHPERLRCRVPSARVVGLSVLAGHELRFGKRGLDGSGKCTVCATSASGAQVLGALFEMRAAEQPLLDAVEGPDYEPRLARFSLQNSCVEGFYYEARDHAVDNKLVPFDWYRDLVVAGARYHGFPAAYVQALAAVRCAGDPDQERAAEMRALLGRLSGV